MKFNEILKAKRTQARLTQKDIADVFGISSVNVSDWENGRTMPEASRLPALAKKLKISISELLGESAPAASSQPSEDEFDLVPQLDLAAACGDGKFAEHVVVKGGLAFKKTFMKQFGISESTGRVIYAQGSSMEPTIGDGRVVLINLADTQPQDGRVFLICDQDGAMILKRLIREYEPSIQQTVWKTRSDNPDKRGFPDKILPDDPRVKIVGRAIWHDGLL